MSLCISVASWHVGSWLPVCLGWYYEQDAGYPISFPERAENESHCLDEVFGILHAGT
jgi:hypothetical protein